MLNKIIFSSLVVVILVAIGFQVFGMASRRHHLVALDAADLLPKSIPGWVVEDRPIAESPDLQKAVNSILNYDSAVFRIYKKNGVEISVYLAYWLPGKIDPAVIDAHTPDICWVDNGWKKTVLPSPPEQWVDGVSIPVPNHRRFTAQGQDLTVLFWQVSGSEIRDTRSVAEGNLSVWRRGVRRLGRVWQAMTNGPRQQIFLRISSNQRVAEELNSAPVHACLELLARSLRGEYFYASKS